LYFVHIRVFPRYKKSILLCACLFTSLIWFTGITAVSSSSTSLRNFFFFCLRPRPLVSVKNPYMYPIFIIYRTTTSSTLIENQHETPWRCIPRGSMMSIPITRYLLFRIFPAVILLAYFFYCNKTERIKIPQES
jgi:hypothetical protein